jgi:hypothetical protein
MKKSALIASNSSERRPGKIAIPDRDKLFEWIARALKAVNP